MCNLHARSPVLVHVSVCSVNMPMHDIYMPMCSEPASCWEKLKERGQDSTALTMQCPGCREAAGSWSVGQTAGHPSRRATGGQGRQG